MSETAITMALAEASQEVLEKMFFMDISPAGTESRDRDSIVAELVFEGDPPGWFRLHMGRSSARSAAADFLGLDPHEVEKSQEDAVVCELANMICGSVLSRIESGATFRLSTPSVLTGAETADGSPVATFRGELKDGSLRAELSIEERAVCKAIGGLAS